MPKRMTVEQARDILSQHYPDLPTVETGNQAETIQYNLEQRYGGFEALDGEVYHALAVLKERLKPIITPTARRYIDRTTKKR